MYDKTFSHSELHKPYGSVGGIQPEKNNPTEVLPRVLTPAEDGGPGVRKYMAEREYC